MSNSGSKRRSQAPIVTHVALNTGDCDLCVCTAVLSMYATLGSGLAQLNFYHEFPSGSDPQAWEEAPQLCEKHSACEFTAIVNVEHLWHAIRHIAAVEMLGDLTGLF